MTDSRWEIITGNYLIKLRGKGKEMEQSYLSGSIKEISVKAESTEGKE